MFGMMRTSVFWSVDDEDEEEEEMDSSELAEYVSPAQLDQHLITLSLIPSFLSPFLTQPPRGFSLSPFSDASLPEPDQGIASASTSAVCHLLVFSGEKRCQNHQSKSTHLVHKSM